MQFTRNANGNISEHKTLAPQNPRPTVNGRGWSLNCYVSCLHVLNWRNLLFRSHRAPETFLRLWLACRLHRWPPSRLPGGSGTEFSPIMIRHTPIACACVRAFHVMKAQEKELFSFSLRSHLCFDVHTYLHFHFRLHLRQTCKLGFTA